MAVTQFIYRPLSTIFQLYHGGHSVYLLVDETGVPGENHRQTFSHNVISSTPSLGGIRTHNVSGDKH